MNVKNLVLGIGIFIVFMFVLHNGIRAFYSAPEYNQFCKSSEFTSPYYPKMAYGESNCTFSNSLREQEQQCWANEGQPIYNYDDRGCTINLKECNYCNKEFNESQRSYNKVVFVIALIIGIIVLFIGYGILSIEPVGSALMSSGIGAIIYGTMHNWENLGNLGRFLLLLLALVLLVWIALRLNKKEKKSWMFWKK